MNKNRDRSVINKTLFRKKTKPGGLLGAEEEHVFAPRGVAKAQEVHSTKQKCFFLGKWRDLITKFPGQLHVISPTPVSRATQPLP